MSLQETFYTRNKKLDDISEIISFSMSRIYENEFVKMKRGKNSLCKANVKKYYKRKKALRGVKEMALVNSSLLPFTVFFAP